MRKALLIVWSLLLCAGATFAQVRTVNGTIISADDGTPLPGANVLVKGTSRGVAADEQGRYTIGVSSGEVTLQFLYTGYKTVEEIVGNRSEINVSLSLAQESIDEVVVTAYGKAKKSSLVGSSQSVSANQLEMRPISSATQALGGLVSGVQVTAGGGQPGSSPAIRIRGFGSYSASEAPLIVVDGAIFNGNMSDIAPSDIASVSLLKDAASTALYGSSAGNGVVLITTKAGQASKSGKPMATFFTSHGISQRAIPEYDLLDVWEYYPAMWTQLYNASVLDPKGKTDEELRQAASKNVFKLLVYNPFRGVQGEEIVGTDGKLNPNATELLYGDDLDWLRAVQRVGYRQEYAVNVSYGSKRLKTYSSFNYMKEDGYSIETMYERYSTRFNASYDVNKWITIGGQAQLLRTSSSGLNSTGTSTLGNPFYFVRQLGPIYPVHLHNEDGSYVFEKGEKVYDEGAKRPGLRGRHVVAETLWNSNSTTRDGLNSQAFGTVNILPGLSFTTNFNYAINRRLDKDFTNEKIGDAAGKGYLEYGNTRYTTITFNQLLNYGVNLGERHHVDLLLGHENYRYQYLSNSSQKSRIIVPELLEYNNFIDMMNMSSSEINYRKEGYFARANYDFSNRYYASFSYRYDASSRFARDRRWGHFWSAGASWRIEQEPFMAGVDWVDFLKLRLSYGRTGVDDIGSYFPHLSALSIGWNNFTAPGILFSQNGNPNITWETQISSDVALEFSFLERIRGTMEFFHKESKDLLFSVPVPYSSGFTSVDKNLGKVQNYGIELELDFTLLKMGDFVWTLGGNLTHLRNELVKLPKGQDEIVSGIRRYAEGHSMYEFWLREFMGIDEETGQAMYRFDAGREGIDHSKAFVRGGDSLTFEPNDAKKHYNGSSIPKIYGGINTTFAWRGIDFGVVLTYQIGSQFYDASYQAFMQLNNLGGALHKDALYESWTPERRDAKAVQLNTAYSTNSGTSSDRWLISGNALALKSITLGYSLPKKWLTPIHISGVRLAVAAENLYFWTARKGINPMYNYGGTSSNVYITARTVTGSLTVNF